MSIETRTLCFNHNLWLMNVMHFEFHCCYKLIQSDEMHLCVAHSSIAWKREKKRFFLFGRQLKYANNRSKRFNISTWIIGFSFMWLVEIHSETLMKWNNSIEWLILIVSPKNLKWKSIKSVFFWVEFIHTKLNHKINSNF